VIEKGGKGENIAPLQGGKEEKKGGGRKIRRRKAGNSVNIRSLDKL